MTSRMQHAHIAADPDGVVAPSPRRKDGGYPTQHTHHTPLPFTHPVQHRGWDPVVAPSPRVTTPGDHAHAHYLQPLRTYTNTSTNTNTAHDSATRNTNNDNDNATVVTPPSPLPSPPPPQTTTPTTTSKIGDVTSKTAAFKVAKLPKEGRL